MAYPDFQLAIDSVEYHKTSPEVYNSGVTKHHTAHTALLVDTNGE